MVLLRADQYPQPPGRYVWEVNMPFADTQIKSPIPDPDRQRLKRFVWLLYAGWTAVLGCLLGWGLHEHRSGALEAARIEARSLYRKDVLYRRWNAMHGGVYALVGEGLQPNPYLEAPERDISTPSGRKLTLINPAYMTRQVHELGERDAGVRGHITSLNPIRPENAPDRWEAEALRAFDRGEDEASGPEVFEGVLYMRLMHPLLTEASCLKCHAAQGYKVGDVRGGISISVPLTPFLDVARRHSLVLVISHLVLWWIGILGIGTGASRVAEAMSERRRVEAERLELSAFVARKHRFESLGALAGGVGHEINNPLNGMVNYAQLIADSVKPGTVTHGYATEILREGARVASIVRALATFAEQERHPPRKAIADMAATIDNAVSLCRTSIRKSGIRIEVELAEDVAPIECNERQIQQALVSLIMNACAALDERYPVPDAEKLIRVNVRELAEPDGAWLRISVSDQGTGIPADVQEHVFAPFFTTKSRDKASGLGLTLVRRIAEDHGGRLQFETEPGKGTTFHLDLARTSD